MSYILSSVFVCHEVLLVSSFSVISRAGSVKWNGSEQRDNIKGNHDFIRFNVDVFYFRQEGVNILNIVLVAVAVALPS